MGVLKVWEDGAWVEAVPTDFLPLSGGTLTGPLTAEGTINANAGIVMGSSEVIDFPNEADKAKILLYGDATTGFGLGITSGTMNLFASGTIKFQQNSITGTEWGNFTSAGLGPRTSVAAPMQNNWTGSVNFTVNPATVTCDIDATCPTSATGSYFYQFAGIPAGVSGPRATITMHTKAMTANYGVGLDCWVEAQSGGVGVIFPGVNDGTQKAPPGTRIYTTLTWAR